MGHSQLQLNFKPAPKQHTLPFPKAANVSQNTNAKTDNNTKTNSKTNSPQNINHQRPHPQKILQPILHQTPKNQIQSRVHSQIQNDFSKNQTDAILTNSNVSFNLSRTNYTNSPNNQTIANKLSSSSINSVNLINNNNIDIDIDIDSNSNPITISDSNSSSDSDSDSFTEITSQINLNNTPNKKTIHNSPPSSSSSPSSVLNTQLKKTRTRNKKIFYNDNHLQKLNNIQNLIIKEKEDQLKKLNKLKNKQTKQPKSKLKTKLKIDKEQIKNSKKIKKIKNIKKIDDLNLSLNDIKILNNSNNINTLNNSNEIIDINNNNTNNTNNTSNTNNINKNQTKKLNEPQTPKTKNKPEKDPKIQSQLPPDSEKKKTSQNEDKSQMKIASFFKSIPKPQPPQQIPISTSNTLPKTPLKSQKSLKIQKPLPYSQSQPQLQPQSQSQSILMLSTIPIDNSPKNHKSLHNTQLLHNSQLLKQNLSISTNHNKLEYDKVFLNFYLRQNSYLSTLYDLSQHQLNSSVSTFDSQMSLHSKINFNNNDLKNWFINQQTSRGFEISVEASKIVESINSLQITESQVIQLISKIPIKYLQFYENVRPPYFGTFSKKTSIIPKSNPFYTKSSGLDYEYDSDVEWENNQEDDEGEDVDLDGEDSENEIMDETTDHLDDFVAEDDQDINTTSKKRIFGPLKPVIKINNFNNNDYETDLFFNSMQAEKLRWNIFFPIDPFKNYWELPTTINSNTFKASNLNTKTDMLSSSSTLDFILQNQQKREIGLNSALTTNDNTPEVNTLQSRKKAKTVIVNKKDLLKMCDYITENDDFGLGTLVDVLTKELNNYTRKTIKNTIENIARKDIIKGNQRKWTINPSFYSALKL
ncbi:RLF2 family protein ASCRUDRAFT_72510 [Ascoidea rubescens DSM 1968]|uniref:Uncharacterized protein n=1 Tax=Ascoidea rubescens DSM 1968 TaxID=1344418 RepID=A0A1D2VA81_9ASCO|nr:hypothetical protein ASCRUDRAFT_72510 [Ascoidea rubescens DSM 1968]ODV58582.1 hypothetical protein ASCRUDRAFT_72510 [Ascoidea rubescens DSM 1968]